MQSNTTLESYLVSTLTGVNDADLIRQTVIALTMAALDMTHKIARNSLSDRYPTAESAVLAVFDAHLRNLPIDLLIAGNFEQPSIRRSDSNLVLGLYPLEPVDSLQSNIFSGSIFSLFRFSSEFESLGLSATDQAVAGFFIVGAQTRLVFSCGKGTNLFRLDPDREQFVLCHERIQIPQRRHRFSIDTSNYRFWDRHIRHYIDDCISGIEGTSGFDYVLSWSGSLVAEAYRILVDGGVYLYPDDNRPGYQNGCHYLFHEALPIAYLIDQAGGQSVDGHESILTKQVTNLDTRVPLIFGGDDAVGQVLEYCRLDPTETTRSPLFENRSLLRN